MPTDSSGVADHGGDETKPVGSAEIIDLLTPRERAMLQSMLLKHPQANPAKILSLMRYLGV
jgi:hypothetical protein